MVIEFEIQRDPTFGGNGVLTNNQSSGIYNTKPISPYKLSASRQQTSDLQYRFQCLPMGDYHLNDQVNLGQAITFASGPVSFRPNGVNAPMWISGMSGNSTDGCCRFEPDRSDRQRTGPMGCRRSAPAADQMRIRLK